MKLKQFFVHTSLGRNIKIRSEKKSLQKVPSRNGNFRCLRSAADVNIKDVFSSEETSRLWNTAENQLDQLGIPAGGVHSVNPGDRRAIYYLVSFFKPASVLEIGTNVGGSTTSIASALFAHHGEQSTLVTVDILDVNDHTTGPWVKDRMKHSPLEMINQLGCEKIVEFVTNTAQDYFSQCKRKFDFIFLDGNHAARSVYEEIPIAASLLNDDGIILLHDYFPNLAPLWAKGVVIPGPFLAVERLRKEGARITAVPLGELPWPTKLQSNVTSLALLFRSK